MSRWNPPWLSGPLGVNPRAYGEELAPQAMTMRYWQQQARPEVREKLKKLPRPVLETLFRRLRKWTFYRDLNGERYYMLYRGVRPDELAIVGGAAVGSPITLTKRTSYTADPNVALIFSQRYGTRAIGEWVPESAIVSAPFAFGVEFLSDYSHGELEIIVDPHTGIIADENLREDRERKYAGWMGHEKHPWFIEQVRFQEKLMAQMDAGKEVKYRQLVFPGLYRIDPPTPDAKTSRGF
jgi:hypothetical protein